METVNAGTMFGRWHVLLELYQDKRRHRYFYCKCECGEERVVRFDMLKSGKSSSCGCLKVEMKKSEKTVHGMYRERVYKILKYIKQRCLNPKNSNYKNYGGRGISICNQWMDFNVFCKWAISNGYRDDLTIERIDVNGDYIPDNCTWIPKSEQSKNRRCSLVNRK